MQVPPRKPASSICITEEQTNKKNHFRMSKELHLHHFSLESKGLCGHMVLQKKNQGPQLRVVYFCRMHHKELFSGNEFLFLNSTNQNTAPSLIQIYTHNTPPPPICKPNQFQKAQSQTIFKRFNQTQQHKKPMHKEFHHIFLPFYKTVLVEGCSNLEGHWC